MVLGVTEFGKFLVVVGLIVTVAGLLLWAGVGKGWLGKLPGDITYSKDNFKFFFPIATCLALSLALSLILWLINHFRK